MKRKKEKYKSVHEHKKSRKHKKKYKKQKKHDTSNSSDDSSGNEQEWVEKTNVQSGLTKQDVSTQNKKSTRKEEPYKREEWMNMKNTFPCVFNDKKSLPINLNKHIDQSDSHKLGQSSKELNPYWKNGGNGLPCADVISTDKDRIMDADWLKKSLLRAQEEAESKGISLKEVAADRWGSLEVIQSMILKAEKTSKSKLKNDIGSNETFKIEDHIKKSKRHEIDGQSSNYSVKLKNDYYKYKSKSYNQNEQHRTPDIVYNKHKPTYKKPIDDNCSVNTLHNTYYSHIKKWQKPKTSYKTEEDELNTSDLKAVDVQCNSNANNIDNKETQAMTESELNKLGAKIVKAEIMGDVKLADELKIQLKKARELATNNIQLTESEKDLNVILTRTDIKGVTRPLESRSQSTSNSLEHIKQKNVQTHSAGKRMLHYFDDDKYSLQQLFQREKGRSTDEDDALFTKIVSKNIDMDEIFEEQITRIQSTSKQDDKDRSVAIKEHKQLSKSLDTCHWCIDSKYMLKHMIIILNSEICLSLPAHISLTEGHCIITPVQHIACQLQLDENIWEKLKAFKKMLYNMFVDQNKYPVFYECYKNRRNFLHMRLECVPLPKKIGQLIPMYFKKALLECETEWSMNRKIIELEHRDIRQAIPNGLSYFMVEFENGKGYAHVIEDEHLFPINFAEEIIGGMLDLSHDVWRKPKKENFDQQREKVFKFLEIMEKYDFTIT